MSALLSTLKADIIAADGAVTGFNVEVNAGALAVIGEREREREREISEHEPHQTLCSRVQSNNCSKCFLALHFLFALSFRH